MGVWDFCGQPAQLTSCNVLLMLLPECSYVQVPLTLCQPHVYINSNIKFPRITTNFHQLSQRIYAGYIGHYKSMASQAFCIEVLYISFQLGSFYSQEYSPEYKNTDPKVEV